MEWKKYISSDPQIHHGKACLTGTRIPVSVVLDNLAAGLTPDQIMASYPALNAKAILSAIAYAAELAREEFVSA